MRNQTAVTRTALLLLGLAAAAVGLVACGSGGSNTATAATSSGTKVVSVKTVMGTKVFVNRKGKTLYSPVQEKTGMIKCTGTHGCTSIWMPVKFSGAKSQLKSVNSGLGTVRRPDGSMQVAFHRKPLYSFSPEGPGQLTGNNVKDQFGSQHFTWHAIGPAGTSAAGTGTTTGGGSYGGGGGSYGGGGYGY
jgi:predicted lipoprotein with Yx(FWY)xxD motif